MLALLSGFSSALPEFWADRVTTGAGVVSGVASGLNGLLLSSAQASPLPQPQKTCQLRKGSYLGRFKVTFYWLVEESSYEGKKTCPLYTTDGRLIGRFTPQFMRDFRTEACALLSDGRIISYMKRRDRCEVVETPVGANGYTLTELKSVAVDPSLINVGSTLYIPDADDMPVGNNLFHDGVFRAHDIGSAVKGQHLDVYLGLKSNMDYFRSTSLCRGGEVDVYLLQ